VVVGGVGGDGGMGGMGGWAGGFSLQCKQLVSLLKIGHIALFPRAQGFGASCIGILCSLSSMYNVWPGPSCCWPHLRHTYAAYLGGLDANHGTLVLTLHVCGDVFVAVSMSMSVSLCVLACVPACVHAAGLGGGGYWVVPAGPLMHRVNRERTHPSAGLTDP
jgi:hypothetical protein